MSELRQRRYKDAEPTETVKKLKNLLKELGIDVEEKWSKESSVGTFSLRICIKGTDIGQNGKGMTREFAMASGYAEFFERMQNGMLRFRMEKPTKELPFANVPDEKHLQIEEVLGTNFKNSGEIQNILIRNILKQNGKEKATKEEKIEYLNQILKKEYNYIPYYSVKNKDIEYIPDKLFSYLFDTNGMCAGNSNEEALIEGFSEILERYVGLKIFKEKVCLPEIPEKYLEKFPKVKAMVEKLKENQELYFRLVDCSFGGKYPVAGLYIIEKNTGKFGFKLGAHPDYGIAMERCFTEAAQGRKIEEYAESCIFDFYEGEDAENRNLTEFIFADLSAVPYQMLGEKTDFSFTEIPDVSELDNKEILKRVVAGILNDGYDILIRNVSFLGFPAFSIAIPGMSEVTFDPKGTYFTVIATMQEIMKDFSKINLTNIRQVVDNMETIVNKLGYDKMSLIIGLKDMGMLPCESIGAGAKYFLAICYIMNGDYGKAAKMLENLTFLADNLLPDSIEKIFVKAVYYYASAMDKLHNHNIAMHYIKLLYDDEIANGIDMSFEDRENIMINHFGITEEDYVDNDDSYYLPFMKRIRETQRDNPIEQMENRKIFE